MQADYGNGLVTKPEDYSDEKLKEHLDNLAEKVTVFPAGSNEHIKATIAYSNMTANQRRTLRKKLKK